MQMLTKLFAFFKDSYREMVYHVTWSPLAELRSSATLVLVASLILTLVIWGMDIAFSGGLNLFYNSFR